LSDSHEGPAVEVMNEKTIEDTSPLSDLHEESAVEVMNEKTIEDTSNSTGTASELIGKKTIEDTSDSNVEHITAVEHMDKQTIEETSDFNEGAETLAQGTVETPVDDVSLSIDHNEGPDDSVVEVMVEGPVHGESSKVSWDEPEDLKNEVFENDNRPNAYVTLCWDDSNVFQTLVLFHQLRKVRSTKGQFIVMSNDLSARSRKQLKQFGIHKIYMIPSNLGTRIGYARKQIRDRDAILWTKLYIWALTEFSKILLLDTDMLILRNIDHLFQLPELAASPMITPNEKIMFYGPKPDNSTNWNNAIWHPLKQEEADTGTGKIGLNSGLMVLRPSLKRFYHMRALIEVLKHRPCCPTQEFFYRYFENIGKFHRLAPEYHVRCIKIMENQEEALALKKRAYVYHFVGVKPWKRRDAGIEDSYMSMWKVFGKYVSAWMRNSSYGVPEPVDSDR
jgi:hypothetical protein